ncbi:hypothetical protein DICA2_C07492 [Diutina catenulata]
MRITKLLFALQAFATLTLAEWVISTDTVTRGTINLSLGSITIKPGVFWSIINNAVSIFTGNLSVGKGSGFYITSTSNLIALNVALAGIINSITNDGIIQFNSAKSLTAPTVNLVGLSMTNNGQMYFGGDGSVGVPEFSLTAANWKNNGLISFYQKTMSTGVVLLGGGGAVLPITNDGDICFFNTVFQQTTSIKGDGCLHVIGSSLMNLSQTLISVAQSQTILFEPGSTGDILTSPLALSNTYTVRGFGDGMRIGNSLTIVRYSYSGSILTLTLDLVGLVNQKIDIGPGYDKSKFALVSKIYPNIGSPLRNALVYRGPVPSGAATDAKCGSCTSLVEEPTSASTTLESIPTATSESSTSDESSPTTDITITSDNTESSSSACHECTEYTTTWTTTGEDGKPTTGSGIVDVTTDSDGSLVTSTSNYPQPSETGCAECTEYTTTWTTTGEDGKPTTGSGIVDVTTDSDGSLVTSTSNYPEPSNSECADCTEYTTTWTTTGEDGKPTTGSGIVDVTTDSDGSLVTSTSNYPQPSETGCAECTEYTTTWTTTGEDGKPTTGSGIVDVTTDSDGSLVTSTSNYPQPSETGCAECTEYTTTWTTTGEDGESSTGTGIVHVTTDSDGALSTWTTLAPQETCADCTEYTTTWTTTGEDGKPTTGSGIVDVTTDSDGSLVTSTSNYPQPSETGCAECTEYTTTWTTTGEDGKPTTGSGIVDVTTDSDGSLVTSTSNYPEPSNSECADCTEYTTTWTTTGEDGKPTTGSGIVDVTTDSDGSLVTSTSNYPQPSETGCAECTEYTTTWTTTGEDGKPTTGSGIVDVTTDSDGSLVTSTSNYPEPSNSECADCTEYTTTWTTTGEDGKPTTGSGIVDVTTDSDGSLVTSTSNYPQPSETGCAECTEYTTTWTTTGEDGKPTTGSGIVDVTTDSDGSLVTSTSNYPQPSETGCAECTEYTTTWTTTGEDGKPTTGSGIVDVTTDSDGSLVTSTSNYPQPSETGCAECTEYTTTWTTTGEDGKPTTGSGIVDVTTDSDGSLVTSTSNYPEPSNSECADCTEYTTTWTTTGEDGKPTTGSGIVDVTTDSDGSLVTSTSNYPQPSETGCAECTEYTTTWTTTGEDGKPTTGSGIVDVTTDSDGSLVTSTSNYPEPSNSECADCTEYTTTWTTTGEDGKPTTGSGIVDVTTDSDGSLVTSTSNYPQPSETGCAECTEYTTTWTTTGEDGKPTTGSGIVDVTTDSDGSLVTSTSNYPQPSETGCAECTEYTTTWTTTGEDGESSTGTGIVHVTTDSDGALSTWTTLAPQETCADCTEYTTTWTTTGEDGKPTTGSGIVDVTTDSDGSLVTSTSNYPQPSETGCAECTEYTTTWTTTGEDGKPTTGSGIVDVTTDSDGSLVTSTSNYPEPSNSECADCTEYTTTWTTTGEDGKPTTGSGIVDVTTDSDGSLVTSTSNYPQPSETGCAECTEYTTTWTTTGEDGKPTTGSGIVDVTTDSDGSLVTSTSNYPQPSETGCAECTEYTTTWTTTGEDGKPTTGSGIVDVTTDSDGSLVTSTSNYPQPSETGCAECTEYTTTWTTTGEDGESSTGTGIVHVTTDSDGALSTWTTLAPQETCADCTEYTTTWTTTGEDGKPTTGSGIVDVTTDSDGSLVTSTSNYPQPSETGCAECTEYTTTWTTTGEDGKPTTGSGIVDVTTDSDGSLVTSTSNYPEPSNSECADCTEYTTTWTTTGEDGKPTTGSGIVDVTTDSDGSLVTSTSNYPQPSETGCAECTEYTTTWTTTGEDGKPTTGSGIVDVTTDSDGSLVTSTSNYPEPSNSECADCTEYTTTWTTTGEDGKPTTGSGIVDVTTDSDGSLVTSTSNYPQPSETGCAECTEYTTTWTTTGEDGKPTTGSGIVDVTTDSDGSLVTSTSNYPQPSETGCAECTEYTTTWTTTGEDGKPTTGSGIVDVTTDSDGSLVTSTSNYPEPSNSECADCTEYTTTWTTTGEDGKPTTGSGIVDVTTDSDGSLVTSTSNYPQPSETGCAECTEYTTTWTTTGEDGKPTTGSGIVDVTTDSDGSLVTSTSNYPQPSETGCAECTEYTTTWITTGEDGKPTTGSGIVDVTTDSDGSLVTSTSNYPQPSETGCAECTEYTTTWTTTGEDGKPTTGSGIVDVTTDSDGSLVTSTSNYPEPSNSECADCTEYTTTWTTTGEDGKPTTGSGIVDVTTDSDGSLVTSTSNYPQPSETGCAECTEYTTTWTTTGEDGKPTTGSGIVDVTTDSDGSLVTSTSNYPQPSETGCAECTEYTTTWTTTGEDGKPTTGSGIVDVTTDSDGSLVTSTSNYPQPSETGCAECTEYTTTWTTTGEDGESSTGTGIVHVTTDSDGALSTWTTLAPQETCADCTEYTTTWTTTGEDGKPTTGSGIVDVTTDSDGSLVTSTSNYPQPSETGCAECTEYTTTWTTTGEDGKPTTGSGIVDVTTDSDGSLVTSTSNYPEPSNSECADCTEYTTTWTTTGEDGKPTTGSGIVDVTTDSDGSLVTSTSNYPQPSETGCAECTEYTTTWTTTGEDGKPTTGSGIVDVTTDSDGSLVTSTSNYPEPSNSECADCTEYTTTWTTTGEDGKPTTGSGIVDVTTDSDGSLVTSTSNYPQPSETGCAECTEYTTTWTTTGEDGKPTTGSGIVDVTTDSDGSLVTSTSNYPQPSETGCAECTEYTTTWTTTGEDGKPTTGSGIVDVTTDSDGSLVTSTSNYPQPSETGCAECTEYTTTWTTTGEDGKPTTGSGIVDVTTDSDGSLVTSTSNYPQPSETGCAECTEYTTTWTTTGEDGKPTTGSGIVDVTTDSDGSLVTSTSNYPQPSETGCAECTEYTTTWTTTGEDGKPTTGSGIVDVTTDSDGSLVTSTSNYPQPSETGCAECTEYTTTWTTTGEDGESSTGTGIVHVTTDSDGALSTWTTLAPQETCADCTEYTTTWTTTGEDGKPTTGSGIVDVTTDSDGSLVTSTSNYPEPSNSECADCTEYTTTWTTTGEDGKPTTGSGIVDVTTDSDGSLVTSTSNYPEPSNSECADCTEYTTTWTTTGEDGKPTTGSGIVDVTTDSDGSLVTSTSNYPQPSETGCAECTEYTTTWTTTGEDGKPTTGSGIVDVTTDSDGSLVTSTSNYPQPSETGCAECTEYTTTWTTTGEDGKPTTGSGIVDVTTDSDGSLVTSTSNYPQPSETGCAECTEYTTTWTTTGEDGKPTTGSGIVDVTTDSDGSLVTSTSNYPEPSNSECADCTEYTTTWTTTGEDGKPTTGSGIVDVTTDSDGSLVTSTSNYPQPSETGCAECTEYTTTWTTTGEDGKPTTGSGIVDVTTDSDGSLVTSTSNYPQPSETGCAECTEYTTTWITTGEDGKPTTGSGIVDVTTDSDGSLVTSTSNYPQPSETGCAECTEYTTTWTTTGEDGKPTTGSGIVDVTTDSDGSLVTSTSNYPEPSNSECADCTEYTTTWTTTGEDGKPTTGSGIVDVTTDSDGSLVTSTSNYPQPSETGCAECTEYTTTWTTTGEDGKPTTGSGIVDVTTDSDGSLVTSTSNYPQPSETGCAECTEYTTTWTTTGEDGKPTTGSGIVDVTTDSDGSLVTSTSNYPQPSETGCAECTEYTTTWTTTGEDGESSTGTGIVHVTTDSDGALSTWTTLAPQETCADCTEYTTTWTTTGEDGKPTTGSGIVDVTTDSDGSLVTSTSNYPQPSETGCAECTEYTTTWTTTGEDGKPTTGSGIVDVTTDSDGSLVTSTSNYPEPSNSECADCTEYTTTWTTTGEDGKPTTGSGIVDVTTDSDGSLVTSTSNYPQPSETGCAECTEYTTTWTTTGEDGKPTTGSGIVDVTTDSDGSLVTSTSNYPEPSNSECADCTEYTTTWTTTGEDGKPTTGSGIVDVTTDSDGSLVTSTSNYPQPSETGCAECTEYTTTWTTTGEDGKPTTGSGIVDVTTDSDGSLVTSTSNYPQPSETGCAECTEYTTTWTTTGEDGKPTTGSGIVDVTTDSDGSLVTSTSNYPQPSETGCAECTEYTTTWTTTGEDGKPTTGSGIVDVTTDSDGSLVTSTSNYPQPSETGCAECTEYTTTWTTTGEDGKPTTGSGIVDVTTDSDGSLVTSTSNYPQPSETGCAECTEYTTTWTTTGEDGKPTTGSGIVDVTTDSDGSLVTSTSNYPQPSETGCAECTEYTTTWTTTGEDGESSTGTGIVHVTTDSDGALSTWTTLAPQETCADCTEYTTTWTTTGEDGKPTTGSGIVDVTTDSDGSLVTSTSNYPEPSNSECADCTEYTTTWTTTGEDGKPTTGSGIVDVTTDSDGSLVTSTSNYPEPSNSECADCTEYTTTWTTTGEDGKPTTGSGIVDVTTDSDGSLVTSTSNYPQPSETGCAECTEYTTTWTTTGEDGKPTTGSGIVDVTTDSDGSLVTSTSNYPQPSETGCAECTEYTTTWTTTGEDGKPTTGSGIVDVTTDSDGSLVTSTSNYPQPSETGCAECTEYTTTWTTTGEDGKPTTGSGIVDVTTDSDGSLVTSTSNYPEPSNSECADCTEYTTTWTTTGEDGKPTTGSGIVDVTTDSDGSLVTSTSNYPQPSETGCAECTEYTTTWTTTGEDGKPTTGSGIVDVTTDSDGSLVTSTSNYPQPSETGCAECTEYTTTWITTGEDGKPTTGSGIVDVTTDSDGSLVTSTSNYPQPSETGCAECTEYTTTWTTTGEDGKPTTGSGIVDVTTDSDGSLVTSTSNYPEPSNSECADCTEYTTTWTTTGEDGKPTTGSGIVDVTTDSDGSLVTSTSNYPQPSETGCAECTEYTTTWTTTGEDGKPTTGSGIVDVTTDSDGSLVTSTSNYPQPSETGCAECTEYTTTWTTTGEDGKPTTGSGIVDVTTDSDGSLVTSTSNYPQPSETGCAECTEYTTTWTTTGEDGESSTGTGIVHVTTDSDGALSTWTTLAPQETCADCTEYTTTWTTTGEDGKPTTGSGIVDVTTDSDGSLVTSTSNYPQPSETGCAECTEYTTTWTTTGEDGKPTTGSGIVDVTTDSDGSLVTSTSNYPEPSNSECADCTEYTTTWTTTGEDGKPTTGSGIVDVTTDSDGSLVTSTSNYPQPSETGCAECTEYTTTWTTTGEDGKPTTGSGIVDVTTDSDGSLVTSTSNYPEPSNSECADCTEYTTTWTTTGEDGKPTTGSGIVDVTTDSDGSLVTSTSNYPQPSETGCAECTEYTTTWTTTGEDGKPTTGSGIVDVTTDSDGSLVTSTSNYPQPSETGCAECTEYTTTWTTTGEDGKPTTGSGIVDVTTDSDGSLVTSTSNYPQPSETGCAECTEYTTTWTTTGEDGKPTTGSGIVDVTTDSDGSLVTSTSNYPQPSETGCAECTEYTTTWTTTGEDGKPTTGSGIVDVTTDSDGSLVTSTSNYPQPSETGCAECTEYTTTWTTTGEDGKPTTGSGIVDVTTDSDGSLVTSTSNYPQPSETGCAECTEYTTTWTTTGEDGESSTGTGIVHVTTDSDGALSTWTTLAPQETCADCTEYTTTWTTTGEDGKPTTGSGIVDVTTDSDGSLVTSTSNYPEPSNSECADCTEYTTTWTTTGEDGKPTTGSGIVDVTTDSDGSLVTSTSNYPEPSNSECADCTEYTTTWTTTGEDGKPTTGSGIVDVTTDSDGSLVTSTSNYPQPSETGCAECTEYTTTWTTTGEDGESSTGTGIVHVTTDSDGALSTWTTLAPQETCADCTEYTTTWTTTGEDGKPTTGSGIVDVTTDSDGSLVTSTSNYPEPSNSECADCTEYTTTWTTTGEDGKPTTGSGIVDVTTDSDGSLVTSTSNYPQPSETGCAECTEYTTTWTTTGEDGESSTGTGIVHVTTDSDGALSTWTTLAPQETCADCTEYTTTWTTTGEDGKPTTGSGIVDVTTDSDGSLVTSTSNYPEPSNSECADCTEYTTTWTTTGEDGKPTTGSGIVDVTTDSDGSLVTSTSNYPQPSETGCAECTEYTTTWTTTGEDGKPTTGSGIVDVTTDSDGSLVTSTSNYPQPSETGCAECTEYTTTWTTTGEDGKPTTGSGIVDVTTDSDGSLVTSTSNYPQPSETGCAECTEYTTTWTTTGEDGKPTTGSGIVDVTTDSDGSLVTSTSNYPQPSETGCAECTEYTTTWTTTGEDGKPTTGSGIVDVTTDSDGSLVTSTSNYPQPSETGCAECTEYTTTWTTTGEDGKPTTGSGIVDVTTDSDGSLVTSTSNYPQPSETGCAECTEYTTTWTTTGEDGESSTGTGIVHVTTDSDGALSTWTTLAPQETCADCTEYTTTWTTTGEDGKPTTGLGIVDVTTDSDGSLVTSTSNYPEPSNSECADCTEYTTTVSKSCEIKPTIITTVLDETVTVTQSCQYVVSTDEHGGTHTYTDFYGETVTGYSSNDAGVEYVSSAVVVEHSEMGTVVTYTLPLGSATRTSTAFSEDSGPGGPSEDSPTIAGIEILTTNSVGEVVTVTLSAPSMQTSVFTERLDGWQSQASMNLGVSSVPDVNTLSAGAAPTNAIGKRITLAFVGVISVLLL